MSSKLNNILIYKEKLYLIIFQLLFTCLAQVRFSFFFKESAGKFNVGTAF